MTDYTERRRLQVEEMRKRARKRRRGDLFANVLAGLTIAGGVVGSLIGLSLLFALIGSIGIYIGWNLGVYGLAHAVHTNVGHISYWTAFGTAFVVSVIRRLFSTSSVGVNKER